MMPALLAYIRAEADVAAPMIPGSWDRTIAPDSWSVIYPLGRVARPEVFFHAWLAMRHPTDPGRALFVCTRGATAADTATPRQILNRLSDAIAADALAWTRTWLTLAELRADGSAIAIAIRNAWPDLRPLDGNGQPIGVRVALHSRLAGFTGEDGES